MKAANLGLEKYPLHCVSLLVTRRGAHRIDGARLPIEETSRQTACIKLVHFICSSSAAVSVLVVPFHLFQHLKLLPTES